MSFNWQPIWNEMVRNCDKNDYKELIKHTKVLEDECLRLAGALEIAKKGLKLECFCSTESTCHACDVLKDIDRHLARSAEET